MKSFYNNILFSEPVAGGVFEKKKRGANEPWLERIMELQKSSAPENIENPLQMANSEPPSSKEKNKTKDCVMQVY